MATQASGPRPGRRPVRPTGDPDLDDKLIAFLDELDPVDQRIALESLATILRFSTEGPSRLDRKIVNTALKEMRHAMSVFGPYRQTRKVTIFGSARTPKDHPEYEAAKELGALMAARGWMAVTGAGPGIMEAGHEGAAAEHSIGVNILLPFEAKPNPVIADDPKLINFKYFFTRKLMFISESDAFALFPGGFGTMDETFELLTLIQTGKSDLHPIVMLDAPGGTYWQEWEHFVRDTLVARGLIDEHDSSLYDIVDDPARAAELFERFYRVYHSIRWIDDRLIVRLNLAPSDALLRQLSADFSDILEAPIERVDAHPAEVRDGDVAELPRIAIRYDRAATGRLRMLIDRLNDEA